ncbi:hypothetical protein I7I53_06244 [Histoplasma capsulatum var. duboisii H88]|uniref:Uncharacterized protein n=1 Tax=Ajellomyces capsulatus (strain H88) TaxID=544711 RepID=A0A8A1LDT3_AJEC8|nr:hypothetical protein I7I53_06244 [Histoplasma capsulatum var. duboisii H88]
MGWGGVCTIYVHYPGGGGGGGRDWLSRSSFLGIAGESSSGQKKVTSKKRLYMYDPGSSGGWGIWVYHTRYLLCFLSGAAHSYFSPRDGTEPGGLALVGRIFEEEYQRDSWDTP